MLKALTIHQARNVVALAGSYRGRHGAHTTDIVNRRALFHAISDLAPAARRELTALMWIGRGIYHVAEWSAAYRYAGGNQKAADVAYMIEDGPLGEHLARGLEKLAHCLAPEDLSRSRESARLA